MKLSFFAIRCANVNSVDSHTHFGLLLQKYLSDGFVRGLLPTIKSRFMINLHIFWKSCFISLAKHTQNIYAAELDTVSVWKLDTRDFDTKRCKDSMHWAVVLKARWDDSQCLRTLFSLHTEAWDLILCHVRVCSHPQTCLFTSAPENIMGAAFSPFQNLNFGELNIFDT